MHQYPTALYLRRRPPRGSASRLALLAPLAVVVISNTSFLLFSQAMAEWCLTPACRRLGLLAHFEGKAEAAKSACKGGCDFCRDPEGVRRAIKARPRTVREARPPADSPTWICVAYGACAACCGWIAIDPTL